MWAAAGAPVAMLAQESQQQRDLRLKKLPPPGAGSRGADAAATGQQGKPGAPNGRRKALCFGINGYRHVAPLRNALNDSTDVAAALRDAQFEVETHPDLALDPMKQALTRFYGRVQEGDAAFVYYAGHGFQLEGGNFLAPADFRPSDETGARRETLQVETITELLSKSRPFLSVLVLDACRNNPFREKAPGLAPVAPVLGTMTMFAAGAGQTASDNPGGRNGLFTSRLLASMKAQMPLQMMARKVRDDVFAASGERQRPYIQEDLIGDFFFQPVAAQEKPMDLKSPMADGIREYRSGNWEAAFTAFDKALRSDPENYHAANAAGAALMQLGRRAQAVEYYNRAIQFNPAYVAAFVNRGLAYLTVPRYSSAVQDFNWAINEDVANPLLYQWRGQAYLGMRDYENALTDLNKALTLDSGSPESYRVRGRVLHRLSRFEDAARDLSTAIRLKNRFWQAYEDRAAVLRSMGKSAEASADSAKAAELRSR